MHPTQGQHLWPVRSQLVWWKPVGLTFTSAALLVAQFGLYYKHDSNSTGKQTHTRKTMSFSCTAIMMVHLLEFGEISLDWSGSTAH